MAEKDAAPVGSGAASTPAAGRAETPGLADAERLAAYDDFSAGVRAELAATKARMDELAAAGKVKTATYRQLFAARVTLKEIDARLAERGL